MPRHFAPERGDVVWLQFTPQAGHEQAGRRPAVKLSPRVYNEKVGLGLYGSLCFFPRIFADFVRSVLRIFANLYFSLLINMPLTEALRYVGEIAGVNFIFQRYGIWVRRKPADG
jgi:hypothetical protein